MAQLCVSRYPYDACNLNASFDFICGPGFGTWRDKKVYVFLFIYHSQHFVPPMSYAISFIVSYKLKLPNDIPPSHRGKAIRFTYSLVVGTQRANTTPSSGQGQVVQIPFRVLNHVSGKLIQSWYSITHTHIAIEDGSRPIYDLMNPVVMYKDEAIVEAFSEEDFKKPRLSMRRRESNKAGMLLVIIWMMG